MTTSTNVTLLATRAGQEAKALRTLINLNAADLSALNTTEKTNVVGALNEVLAAANAGPTINDAGTTTSDVISAAEIAIRTQAAIDGLIGSSPEALNSIQELAAALQNSPDTIANIIAAQGTNTVNITTAQNTADGAVTDAAAAQGTADTAVTAAATADAKAVTAQSSADANASAITSLAADVGDTTTDFVGAFVAALA